MKKILNLLLCYICYGLKYGLNPKIPNTNIPRNPLKKPPTVQENIDIDNNRRIKPNFLYDNVIYSSSYRKIIHSISEISYFNKSCMPVEVQLYNLPLRSLIWILRDLSLCKLAYFLDDNNFPWLVKENSERCSYDIPLSIEKMLNDLQYASSQSNISNYEKIFGIKTLEYTEELNRVINYLPENIHVYIEGTNRNIISVYFPDIDVLTFAFRGTNLEESFFEDIIDDTSILFLGETRRSKKLADICKNIISKPEITSNTHIQTTGFSLGARIAMEVALELNCTCIGINFACGSTFPEKIKDKIAVKNQLVHIHNPKDILSNNILHESTISRVHSWVRSIKFPFLKQVSKYQIPTIITDSDRVKRQHILERGWLHSHSLMNIIFEIEEIIADKIYECE